jgi:hypothetical protein
VHVHAWPVVGDGLGLVGDGLGVVGVGLGLGQAK